jgi:hypothetical protein
MNKWFNVNYLIIIISVIIHEIEGIRVREIGRNNWQL